jgi:GNAT superfamily N-acetyltransferase
MATARRMNHDLQQITIQTASLHQLQAIPGIELAAAAMFPEADLPLELRFKTTAMSDLYAAHDDGRLWVAVTDDAAVVGYTTVDVFDDQAYLSEVDVIPAYGRRGIGTLLVNTVVEWSRVKSFATLSLITFRHIEWNAPFYRKLGFSFIDPTEFGADLSDQFEHERLAGIDVSKRVAMRLDLAGS